MVLRQESFTMIVVNKNIVTAKLHFAIKIKLLSQRTLRLYFQGTFLPLLYLLLLQHIISHTPPILKPVPVTIALCFHSYVTKCKCKFI